MREEREEEGRKKERCRNKRLLLRGRFQEEIGSEQTHAAAPSHSGSDSVRRRDGTVRMVPGRPRSSWRSQRNAGTHVHAASRGDVVCRSPSVRSRMHVLVGKITTGCDWRRGGGLSRARTAASNTIHSTERGRPDGASHGRTQPHTHAGTHGGPPEKEFSGGGRHTE